VSRQPASSHAKRGEPRTGASGGELAVLVNEDYCQDCTFGLRRRIFSLTHIAYECQESYRGIVGGACSLLENAIVPNTRGGGDIPNNRVANILETELIRRRYLGRATLRFVQQREMAAEQIV